MADDLPITRRTLFGLSGAAAAASIHSASPAAEPAGAALHLQLAVNGRHIDHVVDPRSSLLDVLREQLRLTGTKKGCDHGQCGACTVLIDGEPALSCLSLALSVRGAVTTIEGLAKGDDLHLMQQAFVEHDALQCGYCTPGQIMSAVAFAARGEPAEPIRVREAMSGNLCRCAAYPNIVAAVVEGCGEMSKARA
jgi:xanthine dehydrogenase YagT iron-sulfur-binding subunit